MKNDNSQLVGYNFKSRGENKLGIIGKIAKYSLLWLFRISLFVSVGLVFISILELIRDVTVKSILGFITMVLIALFSTKICICLKNDQAKVFLYSVLLFFSGSVIPSLYRLAFDADGLKAFDFTYFLLFSIPVIVTYFYSNVILKKN